MSNFEFGEKVYVVKTQKVSGQKFMPGQEFPYESLLLDPTLVEKLLKQRKLVRASKVNKAVLADLRKPRTPKRIRNWRGQRVVVSWPEGVPIPDGTVDGRPGKKVEAVEEVDDEQEELDEEELDEDLDDEDLDEEGAEDEEELDAEGPGEVLVVKGAPGWYDVTVNGIVYNQSKLRKRAADTLKKKLLAG